jgi:hypothetical protein
MNQDGRAIHVICFKKDKISAVDTRIGNERADVDDRVIGQIQCDQVGETRERTDVRDLVREQVEVGQAGEAGERTDVVDLVLLQSE